MSFFGFNTDLPREGKKGKGVFEAQNAFAQVEQGRKLQAFQDTHDEPYVYGST